MSLPTITSMRSRSKLLEVSRAALLLLLVGCSPPGDPTKYPEIQRTPSPDGQLDAALVENGGDATTGLFHLVFIVRHGATLPHWNEEAVARFEWAYRNDSTVGVNPHWRDNDTLALEFVRAAHQRLVRPSVRGSNGPITIVLAPGVSDSASPLGSRVALPRR
jgi:hypothetical protein